MTHDPKRLLDEPGVPPSLRDALARAKREGPATDQVQAIVLGLGAVVDRPVAVPPATAAGMGAGVKAGIVLGVIALVGGGLVLGTRPRSAPAVLETAAPSVSLLGERSEPEPNRAGGAAPSVTIDLDDVPVGGSAAHASGSASAVASGPSEVALLDGARASLATNPTRALALTEEHRRRFPKGALSQEREVIAIEALKKLGRGTEAKQRGDAFSAENPDTIHRRTVTETKK
jgi:hypothetical protein